MSFMSTSWAEIKFAIAHPTTVRKEAIATATSVVTDVALFNTLVPNAPAQVQTAVSVIQAVAVFVLTFLGNNDDKAEALARKIK